MTIRKKLTLAVYAAFLLVSGSCKDSKSYAELLNEETKAVNVFLSDQNVILDIPADSVFLCGEDAPFYRIDPEGNVFMQVIDPGESEKVKTDALVFFRFTRYNLSEYASTGSLGSGGGNSEDLSMGSASFRFNNVTLSSTTQWGSGLQMPLYFLGFNSHARVVVKSQYGLTSEISQVIPYLYDIRYLPAVSE